jgi:PhnB protein
VNLHALTPHLVVRDAAAASDFYARAFGAREERRVPVPDGRLMSVKLVIGDAIVMLADEFAEMGVLSPLSVGGTSVVLTFAVDDAETAFQRAIDAGAEVVHPLSDTFYGDRHGQVLDPFGHKWGLSQHLRDVPLDEVIRGAAAVFATGGNS